MIPSLPKLMALAGVIWAVWTGFRMLEKHRNQSGKQGGGDQQDGGTKQAEGKSHRALDLEECTVCRAWVAGEACDRDACPYRG